ncbi:DUF6095 family protein [Salinimicrobium sp. GXAS 041]|uniref:DUF6095 family protein n=1 Tax=Salinimicrobium sp. GXAS 041 TaxID=3400806 RepID=UPI003C75F862
MEDRKHTNKEVLSKGIKLMAASLPLAFIGPVVLFSSFKNQDHPYFIPVLILALLAMSGAILLMFLGIKKIMKSLFD